LSGSNGSHPVLGAVVDLVDHLLLERICPALAFRVDVFHHPLELLQAGQPGDELGGVALDVDLSRAIECRWTPRPGSFSR
jgi:hypothetical protein